MVMLPTRRHALHSATMEHRLLLRVEKSDAPIYKKDSR